jgi:hypothetical protein
MSSLRSAWAFFCLLLAGLLAWSVLRLRGLEPRAALAIALVAVTFAAGIMDLLSCLGNDGEHPVESDPRKH